MLLAGISLPRTVIMHYAPCDIGQACLSPRPDGQHPQLRHRCEHPPTLIPLPPFSSAVLLNTYPPSEIHKGIARDGGDDNKYVCTHHARLMLPNGPTDPTVNSLTGSCVVRPKNKGGKNIPQRVLPAIQNTNHGVGPLMQQLLTLSKLTGRLIFFWTCPPFCPK